MWETAIIQLLVSIRLHPQIGIYIYQVYNIYIIPGTWYVFLNHSLNNADFPLLSPLRGTRYSAGGNNESKAER